MVDIEHELTRKEAVMITEGMSYLTINNYTPHLEEASQCLNCISCISFLCFSKASSPHDF